MGIEFRKDRNGELIREWYGSYSVNGHRRARHLGVSIKGKPPASGKLSDQGDSFFEASRKAALAALESLKAEDRQLRETDSRIIFEKAFRAKTGKKWKDIAIRDLVKAYDEMLSSGSIRRRKRTDLYASWKRNIVIGFVDWWRDTGRSTKASIGSITQDDAREWVSHLAATGDDGKMLTTDTIRRMRSRVSTLLDRLLPDGAKNPFSFFTIENAKGEKVIHRQPLTKDEVDRLIATAARTDPLAHDLIVTGLSTSFRRGDVCRLQWASIDLERDRLHLTTSKTGADVEIPIFPAFKSVLQKRKQTAQKDCPYVFPEAEAEIRLHPDVLTRRIKKIFALAFADKAGVNIEEAPSAETVPLSDNLDAVLEAVGKAAMAESKRAKMQRLLKLYAEGSSFRKIHAETALPMSTISYLLNEAEQLSNIHFLKPRNPKRNGITNAIRTVTRQSREIGKRRASIYDFHALRTTFVTLAAVYGIPLETVRLFTGHSGVAVLQQYYDRAKGTDVAAKFAAAMPASLTSVEPSFKTTPSNDTLDKEDMKSLASKLTPAQRKQLMKVLLNAD